MTREHQVASAADTKRTRRASSRSGRARRARGTPRWLLKQTDLDAIAQARVLMVLSVLSGEKPVSTAIEELKISRGLYYQLETRALKAMLQALAPTPDGTSLSETSSPAQRIVELEARVKRLEQDKRRAERLLLLTRKTISSTKIKTCSRSRRHRASSTTGPVPSPKASRKASSKSPEPTAVSILRPAGSSEAP